MGGTGVSLPRAPSLPPIGRSLGAAALAAGLAAFASLTITTAAPLVRLPVALILAFALVMLTLARPTLGVIATFTYLVLLAFLRRLLIFEAGWWAADPMLLVAPLVAAMLMVKLFVLERRPLAPDLLSKLILALLLLTIVQVANPRGGGILVGSVGLLYVGVPLVWFFIGRELLDQAAVERLMKLVVFLGVVVAAYGLLQKELGHPPWDRQWVEQVASVRGYQSLNVGGVLRSFGTFSSSGEYALFVGVALAVACVLVLRGRAFALLAIPLLAVALFLSSGRSALIMGVLAVVVVVGLKTRRPVTAIVIVVAAIALAFGGMKLFGSDLAAQASASGNDLVSHQVGGIADPLNPNSSTLLIHITMVYEGMKYSLHNPLGKGTASTNVGTGSQTPDDKITGSTEVDVSNAFVGLGVVGGLLYLTIVGMTLYWVVKSHFAGDPAALPIVAVLIVCGGQWLIGGNYSLVALVWLLIGATAAMSARVKQQSLDHTAPSG